MLIVIGLVALMVGAEIVVHASSRVATRLGVSPMVIGLTVASITTSTPELAVVDRTLSRLDGAPLLVVAVVYMVVIVRNSRHERARVRAESANNDAPLSGRAIARPLLFELVGLLAGVGIVVLGADWLVSGAVDLARRSGIFDAVIGLTIVAIGTSAPELATMLVATIRDRRDVAIGNLIGSSLYNVTLILPVVALAVPGGLQVTAPLVRIDLPVMAAATLACVPVFIRGQR